MASAAFSGPISVNTNRVVVGSWDTASEFFTGTVDEVAVYASALSPAQVANHFNQGAASPPPPPPPPAPAYRATVVGDGPVAYWRLGDASGTSATDTVGSNTGTYRNGVAVGAPSLTSDTVDRAASFDGVNDSVAVPSSAGLSPTATVTVEAWVRPSAVPTAGNFASIVTKAESYALQFNGPRLEFTTMAGGTRRRVQAAAGALVAGQTYHVVGTFDGTTQRLFVNGAQVATGTFSGAMSVNANRVVLGSWDTASEFFNGTIDDAALYAKVLTATQVATHYNQGRPAA